MLAVSPAGPPPTMATSYVSAARTSGTPFVLISTTSSESPVRAQRPRWQEGFPVRVPASRSTQRAGRNEVEEMQRRAIRRRDRGRGGLAVHHARRVVRVIQSERMADLVAQRAAHHARGDAASRAVVRGDLDARRRDPELARVDAFGHADALPILGREALSPEHLDVRRGGVEEEIEPERK